MYQADDHGSDEHRAELSDPLGLENGARPPVGHHGLHGHARTASPVFLRRLIDLKLYNALDCTAFL